MELKILNVGSPFTLSTRYVIVEEVYY